MGIISRRGIVDGSLSECEAEAYQMNRIGIERTGELKRYTNKIIVES